MIRRLLSTDLFPILLPFSLTWPEVAVTAVTPGEIEGRPVWRLAIQLPTGFFHTPQIATNWTVVLDQKTYQLLRAECPYTDLGRGIRADGMRFFFSKPADLGGVRLWSEHRVIGLDESGYEKAHSRVDQLAFAVLAAAEGEALFANPIPASQRVDKQKSLQPPTGALRPPPGS